MESRHIFLIVIALIFVACVSLSLVLGDVWRRKVSEAARRKVNAFCKGFLVLAALVVGVNVYNRTQREKEEEARRQKDHAEVGERLDEYFKRLDQPKLQATSQEEKLTLAAFNRLEPGMSYFQVWTTLGTTGKLTAASKLEGLLPAETYTWTEGVKVVTCLFQGDKLVTKAQAGLE